jgi:hypothetical protein
MPCRTATTHTVRTRRAVSFSCVLLEACVARSSGGCPASNEMLDWRRSGSGLREAQGETRHQLVGLLRHAGPDSGGRPTPTSSHCRDCGTPTVGTRRAVSFGLRRSVLLHVIPAPHQVRGRLPPKLSPQSEAMRFRLLCCHCESDVAAEEFRRQTALHRRPTAQIPVIKQSTVNVNIP